MNILTRRELYTTYDLNNLNNIRDILNQHGIKYEIKTTNSRSGNGWGGHSSHRSGAAFEKSSVSYIYKVYVRKEDFDAATHAIELPK